MTTKKKISSFLLIENWTKVLLLFRLFSYKADIINNNAKLKIITSLSIFILLFTSCSNVNKNTKTILGTWEIVKLNLENDLSDNFVKIEFFEGTDETVNHFYLYSNDGAKYEGQWSFNKDDDFSMKFHEGGVGFSHEDVIFGKDYNLSDNQFTFSGTFRHFKSSDEYDDSYSTIVFKR